MNGPYKQYIQVDSIFNYSTCSFRTSRNMSSFKSPKHAFLVPASREVYFPGFSKDMFLPKMTNVVKYDVYFDILLVGAIYVTTYVCFKEQKQIPAILQPRHPGLGTGMNYGTDYSDRETFGLSFGLNYGTDFRIYVKQGARALACVGSDPLSPPTPHPPTPGSREQGAEAHSHTKRPF